jgi:hypothetical protein
MVDALYLPEEEIAVRVLGKRRADDWPLIAKVLERESGLPPVNPVTKMRYWRAVAAWFDRYEHVERVISSELYHYKPKELPCTPGRGAPRPAVEKPCPPARDRRPAAAKKIEVDAAHQVVKW